jgi:hypothetical protein
MENLKKELQEKGYTFFNMKNYPEFAEDYIKYKKYVCNNQNNLLNKIDSVRLDGVYLGNHNIELENSRIHVDETFGLFEEMQKIINTEYLPYYDKNHGSQYWYYGHPHEILDDFKELVEKIVEKFYDEKSNFIQHLPNLTYYTSDCFLRPHRDGKTHNRICAVLIYLNDEDYKTEWGGNIVFEETETVDPIYGNIAIIDFKEGNCLHEVKKVVDGYGRYAILDFVSIGTPPEKLNYY